VKSGGGWGAFNLAQGGLKANSKVKAGGLVNNHAQGVPVKSAVKAGYGSLNHNQSAK
jgi:hypothetical protein